MSVKNVSLKVIASQMKVSINTVSHSLRDLDDISEPLKQRIRKKAIELGYMPNHVAQKMRKDEKPLIAILIDSFVNLYFNTFSSALTKLFREKNEYDFLFICADRLTVDVVKQCVLQRVDLVVTHFHPEEGVYEFAKLNNIQIVLISTKDKFGKMDSVGVDERGGCRAAAKYLADGSDGGYIFVGVDCFCARMRYSLFRRALKDMGVAGEIVFFNTDKKDMPALLNMIEKGLRKIFFYSDGEAYTVLAKLDELTGGVRERFPDLKFIGFDGLYKYVYGLQRIVTVQIDYPEFAETVYQVIKDRLENPNGYAKQLVVPVALPEGQTPPSPQTP